MGCSTGALLYVAAATALAIPPGFQRDVLHGRGPALHLNVDATRMSQAFTGSGTIRAIAMREVNTLVHRSGEAEVPPIELALRARFNPELDKSWFGSAMELINHVTMLAIVLTGAALIREREHGTVERLLVMPVTPRAIVTGKVAAMLVVVLAASAFSLQPVVRGLLAVPIEGSLALFLAGATLHLFATTSLGILLATVARTMPQFGLLLIMVPMPRESMPEAIRWIMLAAPNTHFVALARRPSCSAARARTSCGRSSPVSWPSAPRSFALSLARFRRSPATLA